MSGQGLATIAPRLAAARDAHERLAEVPPELRNLADEKGLLTIRDAARAIGAEFREVDGEPLHPFHCGRHMATSMFIGVTDSARCETCGAGLVDMSSPAQNGGWCLGDEVFAALGERIWLPERGAA